MRQGCGTSWVCLAVEGNNEDGSAHCSRSALLPARANFTLANVRQRLAIDMLLPRLSLSQVSVEPRRQKFRGTQPSLTFEKHIVSLDATISIMPRRPMSEHRKTMNELADMQ
jgi:hypothetical protein